MNKSKLKILKLAKAKLEEDLNKFKGILEKLKGSILYFSFFFNFLILFLCSGSFGPLNTFLAQINFTFYFLFFIFLFFKIVPGLEGQNGLCAWNNYKLHKMTQR